jgi:hypothetical protein
VAVSGIEHDTPVTRWENSVRRNAPNGVYYGATVVQLNGGPRLAYLALHVADSRHGLSDTFWSIQDIRDYRDFLDSLIDNLMRPPDDQTSMHVRPAAPATAPTQILPVVSP